MLAWIFFRAETLAHAWSFLKGIFSKSLFVIPQFEGNMQSTICIILLVFFIALEWLGKEGDFAIDYITKRQSRFKRWLLYAFNIPYRYVYSN